MNVHNQKLMGLLGGAKIIGHLGCRVMVDDSTSIIVLADIESKKCNTIKIKTNGALTYEVKGLKINYSNHSIKEVYSKFVTNECLLDVIEDITGISCYNNDLATP